MARLSVAAVIVVAVAGFLLLAGDPEGGNRTAQNDKALGGNITKSDMDFLLRSSHTCEFLTHQVMGYLVSVNLVNGLNLSDEQMRTILECLREKERLLGVAEWRRVIKGYIAVKERLEKGGRLTKETVSLFLSTEKVFLRLEQKRDHADGAIKRLVDKVIKCLTDAQKEVIRGFVPCHLPPRNLNDPIRAGQAKRPSFELGLLETARQMIDKEFKEWFAKEIAPMARHKAKILKINPNDEVKRVLRIFQKARKMPDVDFELSKKELAKKLDLEDPQPPDENPNCRQSLRQKVRDFILNVRLIDLLKKRLKTSDK